MQGGEASSSARDGGAENEPDIEEQMNDENKYCGNDEKIALPKVDYHGRLSLSFRKTALRCERLPLLPENTVTAEVRRYK